MTGSTGLDVGLRAAGRPMLLYCGEADPYREPMRTVAEAAGARFAEVSAADHQAAWRRSGEVLAFVRPFLDSVGR